MLDPAMADERISVDPAATKKDRPDGSAEIIPGKLYVVGGTVELDGRVSWAPSHLKGFQPANCYVLVGGDAALIVDPGLACHEHLVIRQLKTLLPETPELIIFLTRSELDCIGNLGGIASAFTIRQMYAGGSANPFDAFDNANIIDAGVRAAHVRLVRLPPGYTFAISESRTFKILTPEIRLLATYWGYDSGTKTLFTSDSFTHGTMKHMNSSRIIDADSDDELSDDALRDHLYSKFGWLEHAASRERIRRSLRTIFEEQEIEVIAPTHGCVLLGRFTVERHYEAMMRVLNDA